MFSHLLRRRATEAAVTTAMSWTPDGQSDAYGSFGSRARVDGKITNRMSTNRILNSPPLLLRGSEWVCRPDTLTFQVTNECITSPFFLFFVFL